MTILIAGGGPSGSRLAMRLASNGISVLLVETIRSSKKNAFSSAVIPRKAMLDFSIPDEAISSTWSGWQIVCPFGRHYEWNSESVLGVVLDFSKLRESLWSQATKSGVKFLKGWRVLDAITQKTDNDKIHITISREWEHQIYKTGLFADMYIWKNIKKLEVPTLILKAQDSNAFTNSTAKKINKINNPNIRIITIKDSSHLFPFEKPKRVSKEILSFINTVN